MSQSIGEWLNALNLYVDLTVQFEKLGAKIDYDLEYISEEHILDIIKTKGLNVVQAGKLKKAFETIKAEEPWNKGVKTTSNVTDGVKTTSNKTDGVKTTAGSISPAENTPTKSATGETKEGNVKLQTSPSAFPIKKKANDAEANVCFYIHFKCYCRLYILIHFFPSFSHFSTVINR